MKKFFALSLLLSFSAKTVDFNLQTLQDLAVVYGVPTALYLAHDHASKKGAEASPLTDSAFNGSAWSSVDRVIDQRVTGKLNSNLWDYGFDAGVYSALHFAQNCQTGKDVLGRLPLKPVMDNYALKSGFLYAVSRLAKLGLTKGYNFAKGFLPSSQAAAVVTAVAKK